MNNTFDDRYDIIGDVHGYHIELQKLLLKLGYFIENGTWKHKKRKAIFIGDFINRGPNSRGVINIIRDMTTAGHALAILGNHEINAICYFSKDKDGFPIRVPGNNNKRLLDRFAGEYVGNNGALDKDIRWLRTLPLYLNLGQIRIVHAYWNDAHIAQLDKLYKNGKLKKSYLKSTIEPDSELYKAFTQTIKGIEFNMPKDLVLKDSNNIKRDNFRVKWWIKPNSCTFKELSYGNKFSLPNYTIPNELIEDFKVYTEDEPIVFIGHYCIGNGILIPTKNICCVDTCVANAGRLAAYRYNGENKLSMENFTFVSK